jgi:NADPH:quinone reductase-like Zn-dependent oxidoreductase
MDRAGNNILIIGGTGHYGRFITQSLAKHGVGGEANRHQAR